jgi:hypothetical protein
VAPAGAASASLTVLPTDNTVLSIDFVNSLASSVNGLVSSMKDLHVSMETLQRESREQRGHISAILGELQSMRNTITTNNDKYKKDMQNLNKDIEEKLAKLRASSGSAPPSSSATASSSSVGPSGPAPPATPTFSSTSRPSHRPTRLWFKGFGEVLTTKALNSFTTDAVARLPAEHRTNAKSGSPGFGAVAYVDFPATAAIATIKQMLSEMALEHTTDNGDKKSIRITYDVPIPIRYSSKVLGELWQRVKDHLSTLDATTRPEPIQLSNSNGKLYLVRGSRPLLLFETRSDPAGCMHVTAKHENLLAFQINNELSEAWIADAVAAASRLAPK